MSAPDFFLLIHRTHATSIEKRIHWYTDDLMRPICTTKDEKNGQKCIDIHLFLLLSSPYSILGLDNASNALWESGSHADPIRKEDFVRRSSYGLTEKWMEVVSASKSSFHLENKVYLNFAALTSRVHVLHWVDRERGVTPFSSSGWWSIFFLIESEDRLFNS